MSAGAASTGKAATGRGRLAMNQATVPRWTAEEVMEGCARAGYGGVGLWRDRLGDGAPDRLARRAASLGLEVTSLCRGGWFLAADAAGRSARAADNRRAVDEAAALGARMLVLVCGPAPDRDLAAARRAVGEAIAELAPYAEAGGVALAVEPMHPIYCGDRSVVVTLAQATAMVRAAASPAVGIVLDSYHLWWDPELETSLAAAAGSVLGVQLADWLAPPPDPLNGRGMLGDGTIDLRRFCRLAEASGYGGLFEVEIFNPDVWGLDPAGVLELAADRFVAVAAP